MRTLILIMLIGCAPVTPFEPDAAPLAELYAACSSDSDCASGYCLQDVPGGLCTVECDPSTTCEAGSCWTYDNAESFCLPSCSVGTCRDGWTCLTWDETPTCVPLP